MKNKASLRILLGLTAFMLPLSACSLLPIRKTSENNSNNSGTPHSGTNPSTTSNNQYHTVTFDARGGNGYFSTQTVRHGDYAYNPGDPWKNGCSFDYWEDSNEREWLFDSYPVTSDLTLYAHYTGQTYYLYLDPNGGTLNQENNYILVRYGESFELPTPTRDGYCFAGWYMGDQPFTATTYTWDGNITIRAEWGPAFVIHLDTNGGDPLDDYEGKGSYVVGELPTPEKDGCIFTGWTYQNEPVEFPFTYNYTSNEVTFVATWKEVGNVFTTTSVGTNQLKITGYTGNDTEVYIPSRLNKKKVTTIGENAFKGNTKITKIVLPNSISTVDTDAFVNMTDLQELVLNRDIETIAENVLLGCSVLAKITMPTKDIMLKSFFDFDEDLMPNELEVTLISMRKLVETTDSWSGQTYTDYSDEEYVQPANGVFKNIVNKRYDVVLNGSWTYVPSSMFRSSQIIKSVKIPGTAVTIGSEAFYNCSNLSKVTIDEGVKEIYSDAFEYCHSLKSIVIPDSVTALGNGAFRSNNNLEDITIGTGLTEIGSYAFQECRALKNIVIPDNITVIGNSAFYYCTSLSYVVIPNSVTEIKESAFNCCYSLASVIMPKSVVTIGDSAFNSTALGTVFYEGTKSQWNRIDMGIYNITLASADIEFESKVASFQNVKTDKFSYTLTNDNRVLNLLILDKSIESFDFSQELPNLPIISLAPNAFYNCQQLTSIDIPNTIVSIPNYAFEDCSKLETVHLPTSITKIGDRAFSDCVVLKTINLEEGLKSIGNSAFDDCDSLKAINIPNSVTSLGSSAFIYSNSIKTVCLSSGQTEISDQLFYSCSSLECIYIPKTINKIGGYAFHDCYRLRKVFYEGTEEKWAQITIGTDNEYLTQAEFEFESEVSAMEYIDTSKVSYSLSNDKRVFGLHANVKDITAFNFATELPNLTVESIDSYGFSGCESLKSINIPNSVSYIGDCAFQSCYALTTVTLSNTMKKINYESFYSCQQLNSIVIPKSIKTIEDSAFGYCYALSHVFYNGTEEEWNAISIGDGNDYLNNATIIFNSPVTTLDYVETSKVSYALGNDNCAYALKYIGEQHGSFSYSADLPTGVTLKSLGYQAFLNKYPTSVVLPITLLYIDDRAFGSCYGTNIVITYEGTRTQWNAIEKHEDWKYNSYNITVHCSDGDIIYNS